MAEGRPVVGAQVRLSFTVKDAAGALTDASTQVVTVMLPDGTTSTPAVTKSSTGSYYADFTITKPGRHEWYATTTVPTTRTPLDVFNAGAETSGAGPIVGLTAIRNHLNLTDTDQDGELLNFAHRASTMVEDYTRRKWRTVTVTETHNGGGRAVFLKARPVQSITSVTQDGVAVAATGYTLKGQGGILYRGTNGAWFAWNPGAGNISVTLVAGPTSGIVPDAIIGGTLDTIKHLWSGQRGASNRPRQAGVTDGASTVAAWALPYAVREQIEPYVWPEVG